MDDGDGTTANERAEDQIVQRLQALVDLGSDEVRRLENELATAKQGRERYRRALQALTGGSEKKAPKQPSGGSWRISDERVEFVLRRFKEVAPQRQGGMVTPTQLSDVTDGISGETVRRAFEVLRQRELIRAAGNTRGGGQLYALMPEADDGE